MSDDDALLARFRAGDSNAFDELYTKYGGRLYGFCFRLCGSVAMEAEDLTQEVFVAAFRGLHHFEGRAKVSTYLYKIAVYQWRKRTRHQLVTVSLTERDAPVVEDTACVGLDRIEIAKALAALPTAHRAAFLLVKLEGFTCREAASMLALPVGTVKYHVHEAAQKLRALLTDDATRTGTAHAL